MLMLYRQQRAQYAGLFAIRWEASDVRVNFGAQMRR